jgi:hypothetical protein
MRRVGRQEARQGQERVATAPRRVAPVPRVWAKGTTAPRVGSTSATRRPTRGAAAGLRGGVLVFGRGSTGGYCCRRRRRMRPDGRASTGCYCLVTQAGAEPRGHAYKHGPQVTQACAEATGLQRRSRTHGDTKARGDQDRGPHDGRIRGTHDSPGLRTVGLAAGALTTSLDLCAPPPAGSSLSLP